MNRKNFFYTIQYPNGPIEEEDKSSSKYGSDSYGRTSTPKYAHTFTGLGALNHGERGHKSCSFHDGKGFLCVDKRKSSDNIESDYLKEGIPFR